MRVGRIGIWIVLGMVVGALACSTAIPPVGPADAERTGLSMDTLRAGRDIYIAEVQRMPRPIRATGVPGPRVARAGHGDEGEGAYLGAGR